MGETLWYDHSSDLFSSTFRCFIYDGVKTGSNYWVCGWNDTVWPFMWNSQKYFFKVLMAMLYKQVLSLKSVDENLWCHDSSETALVVPSQEILVVCTWQVALFLKLWFWHYNKSKAWEMTTTSTLYCVTTGFPHQSWNTFVVIIWVNTQANLMGNK